MPLRVYYNITSIGILLRNLTEFIIFSSGFYIILRKFTLYFYLSGLPTSFFFFFFFFTSHWAVWWKKNIWNTIFINKNELITDTCHNTDELKNIFSTKKQDSTHFLWFHLHEMSKTKQNKTTIYKDRLAVT